MGAQDRIAAYLGAPPHPLGRPGFAIPALSDFEWHNIGASEADNWIVAPPDSDWRSNLKIDFAHNVVGNVVVYGRGSRAIGAIGFVGSNNLLICGEDNPYHFNFTSYFSGDDGLMFFGARSTSNDVTM